MAEYTARQIDRLRRNDPSETWTIITLSDSSYDDELSEALQTNDYVNNIVLDLSALDNNYSNWGSLLRVIATREILKKVCLHPNLDDDSSLEIIPPDRLAPFVLAMQQNPNIQTVDFSNAQLSGGLMASFLDTTTSIKVLEIRSCSMETPADALTIASALQRNTNIERLELWYQNEMSLVPFLNGLVSNSSVKELCLEWDEPSIQLVDAVESLLESTETIGQFELDGFNVDMSTFGPIAQGLIQSESVKAIKFTHCNFNSQDEVQIFISVLESKSNLQALTLDRCSVYEDGRKWFGGAILSLLQPGSFLRTLELWDDGLSCYGIKTSQDFTLLLTAVETSPLKRFAIGTIRSREDCLALIASIPKMQVGTLEFSLVRDLQDMKWDIIRAVKRNASLRVVVAELDCLGELLDEEDKMALTSYSVQK
jgi:hypothetical protein